MKRRLALYYRSNMAIIKAMQYMSLRSWPSKAELHHHGWMTFGLSLAHSQAGRQGEEAVLFGVVADGRDSEPQLPPTPAPVFCCK